MDNTINQFKFLCIVHIKYDVIVIGAGAAGMMSAIEAGKRGRKVLRFHLREKFF
jgi:predicted flavoprotein YhiN